ncbi:dual specificity protein kinase splB isoform X2 [Amborella trichopoda]|uniref:dual specificity protein kinase splB isoform X2 n=1 Tax=Amborella trichopoda TaxID=13333 RepID=UPI0009BEC3F5|nr:dual specificity protein kinase splB isoform X2 [Amborella trichopoda]|eukprot:XP_020527918.1 dual specificity protein kinase splB isoform X2 [Amborella trichopoda]
MAEMAGDPGHSESEHSHGSWWLPGLAEKLQSVALDSQERNVDVGYSGCHLEHDDMSPLAASQVLWASGVFTGVIPNGFYSVIPEKKLKDQFDNIPSQDELNSLEMDGVRADIILVDAEKDKKLTMLKQLVVALVKGLHSNPAAMIKKIAGVVFDFYGRTGPEGGPAKAALEENAHGSEHRGFQLLGQIKNGSCRPRAILFKVLADAVDLGCKLMGIPSDGAVGCTDPYKHMSVLVMINSVDLVVDLMRYPGHLIPFSTKALIMYHISAGGESDSAENDSCDSPLEPNSPLCGLSDRMDGEGLELDDNSSRSFGPRKVESNAAGPSLRNIMLRLPSVEGKLSLSHSEPNIANAFWRRSRRKAIAEQRTASSSPEHPLFRARGRSMLSGHRQSFGEDGDGSTSSRSDGASTSDARRIRRRSISITPEISDDIVRAVRAMNETLKQNRLLNEQGNEDSGGQLSDAKISSSDQRESAANFQLKSHDGISGERIARYSFPKNHFSSNQKTVSLPSSPHEFSRSQHSLESRTSGFAPTEDMVATWNKVLGSSTLQNRPLLPFNEWNIDFSELTVGTRVGIGFFGEVFRGIWNGTDVAIKIFLEQDLTAENMEDFCNEISLLSRLRHPNVILFLGACTKPPHLSMVTEYMEMGSLYYLIHMSGQSKKISWRRRLKMLRDICRGLMCIHRMTIAHRDLKSANCLVNKHWTVKICDLGLSRVMTQVPMRDSSSAGTPEWMAPELIRNEPFTEKCDVFSLGVIMWELCTLRRPWEGVPPMQVIYAVAHEGVRLEIPEGPLGKLISDCWAEPEERPSCEEILTRLNECEYTLC